jgi:hypothetical protein
MAAHNFVLFTFLLFFNGKSSRPLVQSNEIKYGERTLWKYSFYYTYKLSKKKKKEDIVGSEIKLASYPGINKCLS